MAGIVAVFITGVMGDTVMDSGGVAAVGGIRVPQPDTTIRRKIIRVRGNKRAIIPNGPELSAAPLIV
jgi:hypothetical protein